MEDAIRRRGIKPSEICLESNDSNDNIKDEYNCDESEYVDISKYFDVSDAILFTNLLKFDVGPDLGFFIAA